MISIPLPAHNVAEISESGEANGVKKGISGLPTVYKGGGAIVCIPRPLLPSALAILQSSIALSPCFRSQSHFTSFDHGGIWRQWEVGGLLCH